MYEAMDEVGYYSIISGAFVSESKKQVSYGGKINEKLITPNGQLQKITQLNGNFVLISKKVFEKVGLLDRIFHHSIGDYELSSRFLFYLFPFIPFMIVLELNKLKKIIINIFLVIGMIVFWILYLDIGTWDYKLPYNIWITPVLSYLFPILV
jgi:hypothetical protein